MCVCVCVCVCVYVDRWMCQLFRIDRQHPHAGSVGARGTGSVGDSVGEGGASTAGGHGMLAGCMCSMWSRLSLVRLNHLHIAQASQLVAHGLCFSIFSSLNGLPRVADYVRPSLARGRLCAPKPHCVPSPTLSPTDPVPRGLLTLCPACLTNCLLFRRLQSTP